jgi:limonene-1,2-epoxide hydrolase
MDAQPEAIVRDFCAAWERRDLPAVIAFLAEDVVYQNVPRPAMRGREAAKAFLAPLIERTVGIDFQLLEIAIGADGKSVLTERMDRLHFPSGVVDIPIMGVFKVEQGRIAHWRDYSDSAATMKGFKDIHVNLAAGAETAAAQS